MCGIAGFWSFAKPVAEDDLKNKIVKMTAHLNSRGPDDEGYFLEEEGGLALGHKRLSIIDTSNAGHQPMTSASKRFVMVYNGEVYNFEEIKEELLGEGIVFKSHSDSEVLLEACALWGVRNAVKKCVGMFAFAIWDRKEKLLTLARDRVGIKPLYYSLEKETLRFASDSKCFYGDEDWKGEIDRNSLGAFVRLGYIPNKMSIYQNTRQLKPGTIVEINQHGEEDQWCYWDVNEFNKVLYEGSYENALQIMEVKLRTAIKQRMIADVPIGSFLSGGVDSSLVVALMQSESASAVKTFSVGFDEIGFDESAHAAAIASHLKTDHTELRVSSKDALDLIPSIAEHYGEPFADSSQIPTMLISKLTRKHVTVALSGDGGDEVFAGYNRYLFSNRLSTFYLLLPFIVRKLISLPVKSISPNIIDSVIPAGMRSKISADKLYKLMDAISCPSFKDIYPMLISQWKEKNVPVLGAEQNNVLARNLLPHTVSKIEDMQLADMLTYLPDDILTKVDRASMAYSLEARVPLLDHRVVEFAFSLPLEYKLKNGVTKRILRDILYQHVPRKLIDRPKMGFGIPLASWLRTSLRDWGEALLAEERLELEGFFNVKAIRKKWQEHQEGSRNWQYLLWNVLMFQAWHEKWRK